MNKQEILDLLHSTPAERSLELAKQWLSKKARITKSVEQVAHAVLTASRDEPTLSWFGSWIMDKDWDILLWMVKNFRSPEIHDWLLEFARRNKTNAQAGKLWSALLEEYKDEKLIYHAKEWLLCMGKGAVAAKVAALLLDVCDDENVIEKGKLLAAEAPDDIGLITKLIENSGDLGSIELGLNVLNTEDPISGSFVASSMIKRDATQYRSIVEEWFRKNWHDEHAKYFLHEIVEAGPIEMCSLAFDWLDEHSSIENFETIFRFVFILTPSQVVLDKTWEWIKPQEHMRRSSTVLIIVLSADDDLKVPKEAADDADAWLTKHIRHKDAESLLKAVLEIEATELRIGFAREWLSCHSQSESGFMLLTLLRGVRTHDEFKGEARTWREQNPNNPISHAIYLDLLKRHPSDTAIQEGKELCKHMDKKVEKFFSGVMLCEFIKLGDPESIERAKFLLGQRSLELRWSSSPKEENASLILALLEGAGKDPGVIRCAKEWFKNKGKISKATKVQVEEAYERAISEAEVHSDSASF